MTTAVTNAEDLRTAYLLAFDNFAITPSDVEDESNGKINSRYARELLATLATANLLGEDEVEGELVWQVVNPGTYDDHSRAEAKAVIDQFLGTVTPTEGKKPATNTKKGKTMTKTASTEVHDCYCGCKEQVPGKSFYRPGHDARHAGNVGRAIAAHVGTDVSRKNDDAVQDLLAELPSDRLTEKAMGIADKAIEKEIDRHAKQVAREAAKATKDAANAEPKVEHGIVTVGKKEYVAKRYEDGTVEYLDGDQTKTASKSAAKSFNTE